MNTAENQQALADDSIHSPGAFVGSSQEDAALVIPARFEKLVSLGPDRIAIKTTALTATYNELNCQANRLAHALLALSAAAQERVAIVTDNYISVAAACMGIVKTGHISVIIDPSFPVSRIDHIIEETQPIAVVTDHANDSVLSSALCRKARLLHIDAVNASSETTNPVAVISPDSVADIVYTSGSTGRPKGIMRTHRFIVGKGKTRLSHAASYQDEVRRTTVSSSRNAVVTALLDGVGSYPWDIREKGLAGLADWLKSQRVTEYQSTPSVFRRFVDGLRAIDQFPDLRLVRLSGEVVTKRDVELFKTHFSPPCVLEIVLGSTETGSFAKQVVHCDTVVAPAIVSFGLAIPNKTVLLLDDHLNDVGFGRIGKIAVKSRYLAAGYWQNPDLTRNAFLDDPQGGGEKICLTGDLGRRASDGTLEFLGREDDQVKIRGIKIEPAEIVTRLLEHPAVEDAYILPKRENSEEAQLLAYVVCKRNQRASVTELKQFLRETLPEYMVPSKCVFLSALPLTSNFKVDRSALPSPGRDRPDLDSPFVAPRTFVEQSVAKIWAEVLALDHIGVHDNFLDLGGHSLTATQVVSRVIGQFELEIPLRFLLRAPTVEDMAKLITEYQLKKLQAAEIEEILAELESLSETDATTLSEPKPE